ncbi:MAG: hypothetical protein VB934_09830 [Polyangiaceae bacterium]
MTNRLTWTKKLLVGATLCATTAGVAPALAAGPVSATGKGIAGGLLLGAELPMITCAIVGVDSTWPYLVFGAAGAAGGAAGGYFLEMELATTPEASVYLMAGGMALVVPTLVSVLNATAYEPGEDDDEAFDAIEESKDEDATGKVKGGATVKLQAKRRRQIPLAVLGLDGSGLRPGVPAVELRPAYSLREIAHYGARQHTELHIPLLRGAF